MGHILEQAINLSDVELGELKRLSQQQATTENNLLKRWIQEGIQREKLVVALRAYQTRQVDLRAGAKMAGLSYNQFFHEVQAHHITVLDDDGFMERLQFLAEAFNDEPLQQVLTEQQKHQSMGN